MGNCFWCYFRQLFISLALRKYKKDCTILKLFWYKVFVHLKLKLVPFLLDFVLRISSTPTHTGQENKIFSLCLNMTKTVYNKVNFGLLTTFQEFSHSSLSILNLVSLSYCRVTLFIVAYIRCILQATS